MGSIIPRDSNRRGGGILNKKQEKVVFCHINIIELITVMLAILTLTKRKRNLELHLQIDIKVDLSYILKMVCSKNPDLISIEI